MAWELALSDAAERFDGGRRSFPPSADASFTRCAYDPPNEDYQKLFFRQATVSNSQRSASFHPHSAGWLLPESDSVCKPVFVAHSVLSAIWLLRETLGSDALASAGWDGLVDAAYALADGGTEEPPSAQKPSASRAVDGRKRPASSAQTPTSKRARTDADPSSPAPSPPSSSSSSRHSPPLSSQHSPPPSPALSSLTSEPPASPVYITTVTSNNRRALRQREKKDAAVREKKRLAIGLVAPPATAARNEHGAYQSITPQDEPTVAWLIKQPGPSKNVDFYHASKAPYFRACDFLAKARALGNPSSQEHAAKFLQAWRKRGTLFGGGVAERYSSSSRPAPSPRQAIAGTAQQDSVDSLFRSAWERCNQYDEIVKSVHIEYRWAQALLGQAYANKMAQVSQDDTAVLNTGTQGKTRRAAIRSEAINRLFALIDLHPSKDPAKERELFRARLAAATKWYNIAQALGWGVFMVMPEDSMSKSWIEYTIRAWGVPVFIELVKKVRPDVCAATKAFDAWLGPEGIAGGPIGAKKTLSIELDAPASTAEVYEILDSESEEEEEDDDDDDRIAIQTSQLLPPKSMGQRSLRQTTLLELFHTVE